MGITYEGALAIADVESLSAGMSRIGEVGFVAPIAAQRVAILPTETYSGICDIEEYAGDISAACDCSILAHGVYDSDILQLWVYRNGQLVHSYVSDIGSQGTVFEDSDGLMKIELDGIVYLESDPNRPSGPVGVSAEPFRPFALGAVSDDPILDVLATERYRGKAVSRHREFLAALNIEFAPLGGTYERIRDDSIEGAVLVSR